MFPKGKGRNEEMKYIVCYSGGVSSALTAIEAVRKYGKNNQKQLDALEKEFEEM